MLVQGTNVPIKIVFNEEADLSTMPVIVATLWNNSGKLVKRWNKSDMTIDGLDVYLPLVENETAKYPAGKMTLEVKGADSNGNTLFWEESTISVKSRRDKAIDIISE